MSAAIGFGSTPAHRGAAYAVFEQFELAEYGNRIPSLTFEIVADDAPVSAGAIAAELSDGIVDGAGATQMLGGFSAYRSEEHTSELQSLMRISSAVFCLKK